MSTNHLLISEVPVEAGEIDKATETWLTHNESVGGAGVLYRSLEDPSLVELTAVTDVGELARYRESFRELSGALSGMLTGDFRRQLLEFVEAPKDVDEPLPGTPYLQLRHVEVKPPMYEAYREWRERTIFEVVRGSAEVEVFLAYHSLLSTEPGVMFVSGFSVDPEDYGKVFASPTYRQIVKEAGDTYITDRGLYTRLYRRVQK